METTLEIHWSYWCNPLELLVRPLGCTPSVRRKYTDLAKADRSLILEHFRQATMRWNPEVSAQSAVDNKSVKDEQKSHMIVATDACLPLLPSGESPIAARVLINYELPTKKETYTSRMTTCLAADGIVINMVVGGEVVTLKSLEESSNLVIAEMPIHVSLLMRMFPTFLVSYLVSQLINMSNANLFSKLPFYKTQALWREGT
ncbi:hypothetical protein ACFX13_014635 [Malus domestica]|uniref:Uncharacterized protein n=1 Tax=Malus domestica TaxID=3750 RepID=A0A498HZC9_MALDO|nr:hypothetical protein DVH24_019614 [Malus domestica]